MPVRFLCKPDSARFWNGVESRSPRRCYGIKSVPLTCLWCTLRDAIFSFLCNPGSEQPGGMHLGPQNCSGFSHFRICWGSAIVEAAMSRSRGIPYTVYRFLLQQFISIKLFHFEYETIQFGSYIILTRSILLIPQAPSGLSVSLTNSDFAMSSPICRGWNIRNNIWWPAGWCQIVSNALPISSCIAHSIPFRIRDHPQSWWKSHSEAEVSVTCRESGVFLAQNFRVSTERNQIQRISTEPSILRVDHIDPYPAQEPMGKISLKIPISWCVFMEIPRSGIVIMKGSIT